MNQTPARLVAIGIYDNKGTLRREVDVREDGTFDPFKVEANEMVYSVVDLGDGSKPSLAPWQTSHRPPLIVNRWVAFTDDELDSICGALDAWIDDPLCCNPEWESTRQLRDDAKAELERRRNAPTPN